MRIKFLPLFFLSLFFYGCLSNTRKKLVDSSKTDNISDHSISGQPNLAEKVKDSRSEIDDALNFEKRIYLKIDELHTGKVYTNKNNVDVFYRILMVPEEENIMLIAENISIGEEGGNFKLVKLSRITDDNSALPKFGLYSTDSLKFIDTVRISGYFNGKRKIINLDSLKSYHP
jgi:hypothetical protein